MTNNLREVVRVFREIWLTGPYQHGSDDTQHKRDDQQDARDGVPDVAAAILRRLVRDPTRRGYSCRP